MKHGYEREIKDAKVKGRARTGSREEKQRLNHNRSKLESGNGGEAGWTGQGRGDATDEILERTYDTPPPPGDSRGRKSAR